MDGRTNERMDGLTVGRTDGGTYRRTGGSSHGRTEQRKDVYTHEVANASLHSAWRKYWLDDITSTIAYRRQIATR